MATIQIVISHNYMPMILQYIKSFVKFSNTLNICIRPTGDITFSVVNDSQSCFASFKIHPSALQLQLKDFDPSNPIFFLNYRQPLKPLLHHFQAISKITQQIFLQFTPNCLHFLHFAEGLDFDSGFKGSWKGLLPPVSIENPILPPLDLFPIKIVGFSPDWFNILIEAISGGSSIQKSTLILKISQFNGIKLILPDKNDAEIDIPAFNFSSFHASESVTIVISLREFHALMSASKKQKLDFYFGPPGHPFVASIQDSNATIAHTGSTPVTTNQAVDAEDEYISGSEDDNI